MQINRKKVLNSNEKQEIKKLKCLFFKQKLIGLFDFRFRHLYLKLLNVVAYKLALKMRHAMLFHHFKTMFPHFKGGKVIVQSHSPLLTSLQP